MAGHAAGAAAVMSLVAWLALDYNVVLVLLTCARRNAEFNAVVAARSYWAWLAWNPVMFALFFGPAATALWLRGTGSALRWAVGSRPRTPDLRSSIAWVAPVALAATMVILWLSGQNRGEVERLWSFLMALALVVGAAALARRRTPAREVWLTLMILQLTVAFVLRYRADVQNILSNLPEHLEPLAAPMRF